MACQKRSELLQKKILQIPNCLQNSSLLSLSALCKTHHLNGGGVAGTEAAATSGAVESTGAGPRAGAAGASLDGASIETLFRGRGADAPAAGDETGCLTARGSAALRGAAGRADAMPEGARRAARACILTRRRGGGRRRERAEEEQMEVEKEREKEKESEKIKDFFSTLSFDPPSGETPPPSSLVSFLLPPPPPPSLSPFRHSRALGQCVNSFRQ